MDISRNGYRLTNKHNVALFLYATLLLCLTQVAYAATPVVVSAGVPTNGSYGAGQNLDFTVTWDAAVTVDTSGGTPYIDVTLSDTSVVNAVYLSGDGTPILTFRYTVVGTEPDGAIAVDPSITLNGATLVDTATGMDPADTTSIPFASTAAVLIDNTDPTVSSINRLTPAGASTNASSVIYRVTFSENVSGVDFTDFDLTATGTAAGAVASVSSPTGTAIDVTVNTISGEGTLRLDLKAAATGITDDAANPINGGFSAGQTYTIDITAPVTTSVDVPASRTYFAANCCYYFIISDPMDFVVHFDSPVIAFSGYPLGTPYLPLDVGGVSKEVEYLSGSGTNALTFQWHPIAGDVDTNGVTVGSALATPLGSAIRDAAGNSVNLTLNSIGDTSAVLVDGIIPTVTSINRVDASPTHASSVDYTVTFSEDVTHVDASDFSITATGSAVGTITSLTPVSASVYTVTVNGIAGNGTLRLDLNAVPTTAITDTAGNPILTDFTTGQTYTIDTAGPSVTSINRLSPIGASTSGTSVIYQVTFSESASGVDIGDFTVTSSTATGVVSQASPSTATTYDVTVNTISGEGTLRLDLNASGTGITDSLGNAISGGFNSGQTYTIDHTGPSVVSLARASANPTSASSVDYTATFSEPVTGVTVSDFTLAHAGSANGTIAAVTPVSGSVYTITVNSITGNGTLRLDLDVSVDGVDDLAGNAAGAGLIGETYTVDTTAPSVSSFVRNYPSAAITNATIVNPRINFSEDVSGVDVSDFSLTLTGATTGTIVSVTPDSASSYIVRIEGVSGDGTLRVDLNSSGTSIVDSANNAISGGFTGGEVYTIDRTSPAGVSIDRADVDPTTAASVNYTVSFSETVTGVDVTDFTLGNTGNANGVIATVTPVSGSVYTVTVNNLVGIGTLRLDLVLGASIGDLAANPVLSGLMGQAYTVSEAIDVQVSFTRDLSSANEGNVIVYTFTAVNNGPGAATGVGIQFTPPGTLTSVVWTCTNGTGGATCPNAGNSGAIAETANLPSGGSLVYMVSGTVGETEGNVLSVTATVVPPAGMHDVSHGEDSATYALPVGVYINGFEEN